MSLTVFIGKHDPQVLVVQSFRWRLSSGFECFSGRPQRMAFERFRATGIAIVKAHFKVFKTKVVMEKDVLPVFRDGEAKQLLKNRSAVLIGLDYFNEGKGLRFVALRFRKYDLGGTVDPGKEFHKVLPAKWATDQFWAAFDAVLENAPGVASLEQLGYTPWAPAKR